MHGGYAVLAQFFFQTKVKVGRIYADKYIGLVSQQALLQGIAHAPYAIDAAQYFHAVAMHGEQFAGPVGIKTLRLHLRPANATGLPLRPALPHALQQQASEHIARGFARYHANTQSVRGGLLCKVGGLGHAVCFIGQMCRIGVAVQRVKGRAMGRSGIVLCRRYH